MHATVRNGVRDHAGKDLGISCRDSLYTVLEQGSSTSRTVTSMSFTLETTSHNPCQFMNIVAHGTNHSIKMTLPRCAFCTRF